MRKKYSKDILGMGITLLFHFSLFKQLGNYSCKREACSLVIPSRFGYEIVQRAFVSSICGLKHKQVLQPHGQ